MPSLRRVALPILQRVNPGDIAIRHYWTGDPMRVHSFQHRGYWYRPGNRERQTMIAIMRLVGEQDTVYDVGSHVGYLALHFARLARQVFAFEPSSDNLTYLRNNVQDKPNVEVIASAVGARSGQAELFIESLSGQNNTLTYPFAFEKTAANAGHVSVSTRSETVALTTLDEFASSNEPPDFVKIDVEGFEWEVLQGAKKLLTESPPILLVEITREQVRVRDQLVDAGYRVLPDTLGHPGVTAHHANHVLLHERRHADLISRVTA